MSGDRAVSTLVGYAITLGITTLLITGLVVATGGYIQDQRERAAQTQLKVVGQQLAADLGTADRLARSDPDTVSLDREFPDEAAGRGYSIAVDPGGCSCLELWTQGRETVVTVQFQTETTVTSKNVTGGPVVVTYDPAAGALEVESD